MTDILTFRADDLRAALARVLPAVATDAARPVLRTVNVEPHGADAVTMTGCDNYRIITMTVPLAEHDGAEPRQPIAPFLLPLDAAKALAKALPRKPAYGTMTATIATDGAIGTWTVGDMSGRFVIDGAQYPSYQQVIPAPQDDAFSITFTASVLAPVLEALAGASGAVTLTFPNPGAKEAALRPMLLRTHGDHLPATAVVMPVRTSDRPVF